MVVVGLLHLMTLLSWLLPSVLPCTRNANGDLATTPIDVVVVGAGASGLAAASRLAKHDRVRVTVLEGSDRVGGRVKPGSIGGQEVALGAQWIHGKSNKNVAYKIAKEMDIVDGVDRLESLTPLFVEDDGDVWRDPALVSRAWEIFYEVYEYPKEYNKYIGAESLGQYMTEAIDLAARDDGREVKERLGTVKDYAHRLFQATDACDHWMNTSYRGSMLLYEELGKNEDVVFKSGHSFMDIIEKFRSEIPSESVKLNSTVTKISWSEDGVCIEVNDGEEEVFADYVIFTGSVGYLKAHHNTLFEPKLPAERANAIEGLELGTVGKIFLVYDEDWWPKEVPSFEILHPDTTDFNYEPEDAEENWTRWISSIGRITHKDKMLVAWLAGDGARAMEGKTDEEVLDSMTKLMRQLLEKTYPDMKDPISILKTDWFSNPLTLGSYSYMSVKSDAMGVEFGDLSKSTPADRLRFAGEATNAKHFSTVHGAIESGWREADKIIKERSLG